MQNAGYDFVANIFDKQFIYLNNLFLHNLKWHLLPPVMEKNKIRLKYIYIYIFTFKISKPKF